MVDSESSTEPLRGWPRRCGCSGSLACHVFKVAITVVVQHRLGPALSRGAGLLTSLAFPVAIQLGPATLPGFSTYNADVSNMWK